MVSAEKRKGKEKKFWSKIASVYDEWIEKDFSDQYELFRDKIRSNIENDDVVLELGTGTGDISLSIAESCKKVVGIDISESMIKIANKKTKEHENVTFQTADAYDLPYEDNSFTKVVCVNAFQTMKDPSIPIKEAERVLKGGGDLLSVTYCYGDSSILERIKLIKHALLYGLPRYWINFEAEDLIELFHKEGFEEIESERIWKKPVVLFVRARKIA